MTRFVLEFTLPGLPPSANERYTHWAAHAAEQKKWRVAARMAAYYRRPNEPLTKARVIITRCSSGKTDFDNRVISMKPILDGLVDAKILLNDTDDVIVEPQYPQEKAERGKGCVKIRVEELE